MFRINLLVAARGSEISIITPRERILVVLVAFMVICLLGTCLWLGGRVRNVAAQALSSKARLARLELAARKGRQLEKSLEELQGRIKKLKELESAQQRAPLLLETILGVTPDKRMWFESLRANREKVEIKGVAMDEAAVTEFMNRLEGVWCVNEVLLKTLTSKPNDLNLRLKSFELNLNFRLDNNDDQT